MLWCQDMLGRRGRQRKVHCKVLELGDVLRSLNLLALAKWKETQM